uniref:C-X-C motif chemokine n=1 Tax=Poecilia formosa TaxID=48698 RepID=A0A096M0N1_POEFO
MKSVIQCIVLLACIAICTSRNIRYCHCIKTIRAVRRSLIADVNVYEPSPACPHREVIVTMTDNSQRCLDPESKFTKNLLRGVEKMLMMSLSPETEPLGLLVSNCP